MAISADFLMATDKWRERGFMPVGSVPADWRTRRVAVRAILRLGYAFVDIESPWTHTFLTRELA
jgi:hypothetical protein